MKTYLSRTLVVGLLAVAVGACGTGPEPDVRAALTGLWRVVLASPGGELPFTVEVFAPGASPPAVARNGAEAVEFSEVRVDGARVTLRLEVYDSEIVAELDGDTLRGEWHKTAAGGGISRLPMVGTRGDRRRFLPEAPAAAAGADPGAVASVEGAWAVTFTDDGGDEMARGEFRQDGERVTGTFLTPTGDYRYLEGDYSDGFLRLSCFDGGHAFLFHARARADGSLEGDFWSRDSYHATWTARPAGADDASLPDPFSVVTLNNDEGRFRFAFDDLDGRTVRFPSPEFEGRVVLVNIFGSWCPNCNDEAPLLAEWDRRYRERGLSTVGLAFEFSGDPERDRTVVRAYAERYGIEFPLLLAGVSDKGEASATLADLSRVAAYPTNVFIDRLGRVREIQSGFSGPGTGRHHDELVERLESLIEELLAE